MKQLRVGGRYVPVPLAISALCWLAPGVWSGLGTLLPSLFVPVEIRDSGWFGAGTLAVLAIYTALVMGIPILMLYRVRIARIALTVAVICFTVAVLAAPALESVWAYVLVMIGAVMMWLPQSNQYMRKRILHGNGAMV
jgi:ABC-type transport system involved in multi-copper enzyme maturation permease subunit